MTETAIRITPQRTAVVLDLDPSLRPLTDAVPAEALGKFVEGIRMVAEVFRRGLLVAPWSVYELRHMFREMDTSAWRKLTVAGQLGAELRPARATLRPTLADGFSPDDSRAQRLAGFIRAQLGSAERAALDVLHRGTVHTLDWREAPEAAAIGQDLAERARDEGFGVLLWESVLAHLLPRELDRLAVVEDQVANARTVIAITDTGPGMDVWDRLRHMRGESGNDVAQVICIALGEQLIADAAGSFDLGIQEVEQLGDVLIDIARLHKLQPARKEGS